MSLQIGIVGFPNVGKSTLFKAITKKQVDCENYPFCTIDPNIGVVSVPDKRIELLTDLMKSKKKIYTIIEFVDIAGLVEGASKGEGLGNKFLGNIKEVDAIVYVLRCFKDDNVVNVRNEIHPIKDKDILDMEMALKDLATIEKRIEAVNKKRKSGLTKEVQKELNILLNVKELLEQGKILIDEKLKEDELNILKQYQLLTLKKRMFILNGDNVSEDILSIFNNNNWEYVIMNIKDELDAEGLEEEERKELGLGETKIDLLIEKSYKLLDLITFITTGEDETRAWTIKRNSLAPQAGGVIHTDFEKCFIKADVINWEELYNAGSFQEARLKGLIRTEGKEYIVKDGDVIEIKSNA